MSQPGAVALIEDAIATARARLTEALGRFVAEPSGEPLHDLRVALRRSAAVGGLFEDLPRTGDGASVRLRSRDLRRQLSEARQLGVSAELLGEIVARRELRGRKRLAASLSRGWASGSAGPGLEEVRAAVGAILAALDSWRGVVAGWAPGADEESEVARTLTRRLRQRRKRILEVGVPTEKTLHEQRVAGKALRYQLELVSGVEPAAPELVRAARRFQETLGAAHDLACLLCDLEATLRSRPRRPLGGAEMLLAVEERRVRAYRTARDEAKRFLRALRAAKPRIRFPVGIARPDERLHLPKRTR